MVVTPSVQVTAAPQNMCPRLFRKYCNFNLHSRHTEVSFWRNLYCDLRLAEGLTSITALPISIVRAQKGLSRLIFFFFPLSHTKKDRSSVSIFLFPLVGMHTELIIVLPGKI